MKTLSKNYFRRMVAYILVLSMIFSLGTVNIISSADTTEEITESNEWSGEIADSYAGGTGTEGNPFEIATAEQLAKLVNDTDTLGKYYKLTDDIVLNDSLTDSPTQWYSSAFNDTDVLSAIFAGVFDGDGHTVSGLYFNGAATNNTYWFAVGLFPHVAVGATIKNVGLVNSSVTITNGGAAGSIVGMYNTSSSHDTDEGKQLIIRNCFADSTVSLSAGNAGGIAGGLNGSAILYDCYFTGSVSATGNADALYGLGWSNAVHVYNFYTTVAIVQKDRNQLHDSAYTTVSDSTSGIIATVAKLTARNATSTLSGFDFDSVWMITSATPALRIFYSDEIEARLNAGVWTGDIATAYADGDGTEENPYQIANGEQLAKLVNDTDTSGKYYKLTANIVLNESLDDTAILWYNVTGDDATDIMFKGTLDGDGHTVSGLYFSAAGNSGYYGTAIIPRANGATVKNIGLVNSNMTITGTGSNCFVASIIGRGNIVNVTGCFADETVTLNGNKGKAGGMVGVMTGASNILNCYFKGTLSATTADPFYATGWTNYRNVKFCYTTSAVSQKSNTYYEFVYTTATDGGFTDDSFGAVYSVALANITGTDAVDNLTNFDFTDTWMTVDGATPILKIFYNKEKVDKGIWTGLVADAYADGDGTKENPYQIANGEQLAKLAKATDTAGNYYVLTADIKLNDMEGDDLVTWFTVYNSDIMFQGNLNGKGHTVSGLYYKASSITDGHRSGLLPVIGAGAVITNMSFENCEMSVGCYGGTVAGYVDVKASEVFPEISYINVEESVIITGYCIGGIVGGGTIANFDNCCFAGTLTGVDINEERVAKRNGIVGNFWGVGDGVFYDITNCYTGKYAPFNYANVLAVCTNVYSGTTETVGGTIIGKGPSKVKADAMNELPNLNWKDVWVWEEGSFPSLNLTEEGNYNSYELGDTDCSNTDLDAADLAFMRKHLLDTDFAYNADVNEDGTVNIIDLVRLKKELSAVQN